METRKVIGRMSNLLDSIGYLFLTLHSGASGGYYWLCDTIVWQTNVTIVTLCPVEK